MFLTKQPGLYEYWIHLRHHGFPSPLLDWTRSPYVAAFFAYDSADPRKTEPIAIFAWALKSQYAFSSDAQMFRVGPYMRTHRRHFLQQAEYSMYVGLVDGQWRFLAGPETQSQGKHARFVLRKYLLPSAARKEVLKRLDSMNINEYSLFGSPDSLVKTIARRELLFNR